MNPVRNRDRVSCIYMGYLFTTIFSHQCETNTKLEADRDLFHTG